MGWKIHWSSGEISVLSRPAPKPTQTSVQTPVIIRGWSGRSMVLATHRFLVPGCDTVGDISTPPICTCTGMSWGDFYLYVLNKTGCFVLRTEQILTKQSSRYPSTCDAITVATRQTRTTIARNILQILWKCTYILYRCFTTENDNLFMSSLCLVVSEI